MPHDDPAPGKVITGSWGLAVTRGLGCQLTNTGAQEIPNNTLTTVAWNSVAFDSAPSLGFADMADLTNDEIVLPVDGLWAVWGGVGFEGNDTGRREIAVRIDGSSRMWDVRQIGGSDPTFGRIAVSGLVVGSVGQRLDLRVRHTAGEGIDIEDSTPPPFFGAALVAHA